MTIERGGIGDYGGDVDEGLVLTMTGVLFARVVELRKQIPSELVLKNGTKEKQAFKVKTTAPKKYCVKPNTGIVEPGASLTVTVMMQAHREVPSDFAACKDKFLVQSCPSGASTDMTELFARANEKIKETKLRVAYVKHDKSTVQEEVLPPPPANETPADERVRLQKEVGLLQSRNRALVTDLNLMQKRGGKVVRGFTLLHILLTAILAFILGRYL